LIDGTGKPPIHDAAVLIEDNQIRSAGSAADIKLPASKVVEHDAGGIYILPRFFDTHVHLLFEGFNMVRDMQESFSTRFYKSIDFMRRTVKADVTSVRDAGGADMGVKQTVERGKLWVTECRSLSLRLPSPVVMEMAGCSQEMSGGCSQLIAAIPTGWWMENNRYARKCGKFCEPERR
jgi:hypothetical protein